MILFVLINMLALAAATVELPPPCASDVCDVFNEGDVFDLCISKLKVQKQNELKKKCQQSLDDQFKLENFKNILQHTCLVDFGVNVTVQVPPCDDPLRQLGDKLRERDAFWEQANFLDIFSNLWAEDLIVYSPFTSRALNYTETIEMVQILIANNFDAHLAEIESVVYPCGEEVGFIDIVTRWIGADGSQRRAFSKYRLVNGVWLAFFEYITLIPEDFPGFQI